MKDIKKNYRFKNKVSNEDWVCENPKKTKVIDNVEYLTVRRPDSSRSVLMRKDSLALIK